MLLFKVLYYVYKPCHEKIIFLRQHPPKISKSKSQSKMGKAWMTGANPIRQTISWKRLN